jgi:hypothetical protein
VLGFQRRLIEAAAVCSLGLQLGLEGDLSEQALRGYNNLASFRMGSGQPTQALELVDRGLALARERGDRGWERDLIAQRITLRAHHGEWDEALAEAESLRRGGEDVAEHIGWGARPLILAARGERAALQEWLARDLAPSEWQEQALDDAVARAVALHAVGDLRQAAPIAAEAWAAMRSDTGAGGELYYLGDLIDILLEAGQTDALTAGLEPATRHSMPVQAGELAWLRGLLHAGRGEAEQAQAALREAARALREVEHPYRLARALLDLGLSLSASGSVREAEAALEEARELYASLGAQPWLERTQEALAPLTPAKAIG